ncbi:MAG: hypothetical protein COU81_00265 [Candidatus Portnoybacteria bacterium CG10_big_fil_rev_8_21_14_0_10_36_7]|uniref:Uncharacterized protein n=1 Tax=Candidatus Portnoybacteria bacterium CG10_big_fil_rev_8_21_14_0_10_36_7 TaxID=1974812 RepID=A0A2M8KF32_9BACT|nr:MAG: hypothetical protein COU81_00265 [Candidatus Portnoybacteria bacterium CG10_big_fil_rev_8_21_14_0_10_36_7]
MENKKKLTSEFRKTSINYILAGFGLVAALAWNEAIKSFLDLVFGSSRGSITAKFIYAIIITFVVVILSIKISKYKSDIE